ncbi:transcriptional regulator [Streptomyces sparsogenes]|uniref:transcriptional regulator n=1 Tax=Streptomyces sparsogenes TaxID=67365 RepID=UPI0033E13C08
MSVPLYQAKAEFFRMPGYLVRIRRLAAACRLGIVGSGRVGSTTVYEVAGGVVAELRRAARRIVTEAPAGRSELLAQPGEAEVAAR